MKIKGNNPIIECACGCGNTLEKYDSRGRERKFLPSHWAKTFQPTKRTNLQCDNCGKEFVRPDWYIKVVKNNFCCSACNNEYTIKMGLKRGSNNGHYNTITVPCAGCGKPVSKAVSLIMRRNNRVYCKDCIPVKTRSGRKGFYEGYPKEFSPYLRHEIRKRDNHTCRLCGRKQPEIGTLHVHHIDYDITNNNRNNLISLCCVCHGKTNFAKEEWTNLLQSLDSHNS